MDFRGHVCPKTRNNPCLLLEQAGRHPVHVSPGHVDAEHLIRVAVDVKPELLKVSGRPRIVHRPAREMNLLPVEAAGVDVWRGDRLAVGDEFAKGHVDDPGVLEDLN